MSVTGALRSASMVQREAWREIQKDPVWMQTFWKQRNRMEGNGCARSPVIPETCGDRSQKLSMHWDRRKPIPMIKRGSFLENWIRKGIWPSMLIQNRETYPVSSMQTERKWSCPIIRSGSWLRYRTGWETQGSPRMHWAGQKRCSTRTEGKYPIPMEKQEREEALPIRMERQYSMAMMSSSVFQN